MINYWRAWLEPRDDECSLVAVRAWFDLDTSRLRRPVHTEKLNWLNAHYIKHSDDALWPPDVSARLARAAESGSGPLLTGDALYKDRAATLNELADAPSPSTMDLHPAPELMPGTSPTPPAQRWLNCSQARAPRGTRRR